MQPKIDRGKEHGCAQDSAGDPGVVGALQRLRERLRHDLAGPTDGVSTRRSLIDGGWKLSGDRAAALERRGGHGSSKRSVSVGVVSVLPGSGRSMSHAPAEQGHRYMPSPSRLLRVNSKDRNTRRTHPLLLESNSYLMLCRLCQMTGTRPRATPIPRQSWGRS